MRIGSPGLGGQPGYLGSTVQGNQELHVERLRFLFGNGICTQPLPFVLWKSFKYSIFVQETLFSVKVEDS